MNIFRIAIGLICFSGFSQGLEMTANNNHIDYDYKADNETFTKLKAEYKKDVNLFLVTEKVKDSVYTIYLLNNSKESVSLQKSDWHLYLIQEAKDEKGIWKPIEFFRYSWCGNSYSSYKLASAGIIKAESIAYNGDFKTEIRFKLLIDDKVYYSNAISGTIFLSQFFLTDKVKEDSRFNEFSKIAGDKTSEKIIFLEPYGMQEFANANAEYLKWLKKKAKERAQKGEK
ncbi:MAG: hypothetical protein V4572_09905 [Bacteroidota bacterium]